MSSSDVCKPFSFDLIGKQLGVISHTVLNDGSSLVVGLMLLD